MTSADGDGAADRVPDHSMWSQIDLVAETAPHRIPDLDVDSMRVIMTLRTASDMIFYDIHSALRRSGGITAPVLRVLLFLQIYERLELADLTRMTGMSRASASALIATMSEQGLIAREPSGHDRRKLVIVMAPAGERAFVDSYRVFNRREAFWAEGLDAGERRELIRLVGKLVAHRRETGDYHTRH